MDKIDYFIKLLKEKVKELPVDLQRKIWEYDDTWIRNFDMDVVPYLQQSWFIKYFLINLLISNYNIRRIPIYINHSSSFFYWANITMPQRY